MGKSRMMGAGLSSASLYNSNPNLNTFGGDKKQGITSRVGLDNWANVAVQTYSNGYGKNKLFVVNQLGGVGAGRSMFNIKYTQKRGTHTQTQTQTQQNFIEYFLNNVNTSLITRSLFKTTYTSFINTYGTIQLTTTIDSIYDTLVTQTSSPTILKRSNLLTYYNANKNGKCTSSPFCI